MYPLLKEVISLTQAELIEQLAQCKTWKTNLIPMRRLAEQMGNPQDRLRFVHVAGTNGKGSTCAMLASMLQAAGYRTGRFVSPYILEFRERIQINGEMIPEADLCRIGVSVLDAVKALAQEGVYPTEFDVVTMIGFLWFAEQGCDMVVLEVGVGGGIDSTNIITPESVAVSVITSISLDHTSILGGTEAEIAAEKAGILKENGVAVVGSSICGEALQAINNIALQKMNRILTASTERLALLHSGPAGMELSFAGQLLSLPLPGLYQMQNTAVALTVIDVLREQGWEISADAVAHGLAQVRFPARMELVGQAPLFWIDGAHNPAGVAELLRSLDVLAPDKKRVCINGMMQDKNCAGVVAMLAPYFSHAITVTPGNPRAMQASALADLWRSHGIPAETADDIPSAIQQAVALAGEAGAVVCCGSLFLCADLRPHAIAFYQDRTQK